MNKPSISWIPAHPSAGVESMRRCWKSLDRAKRDSDRFAVKSIIQPVDQSVSKGFGFRLKKAINRSWSYPLQIALMPNCDVAHVLDHSWADMLDYVAKTSLKVVTVHDLFPMQIDCNLSVSQRDRFRERVARISKADHVVAVSEYTKIQVHKELQIPIDRITVIPNGVDIPSDCYDISEITESIEKLKEKYFVVGSIGSTNPRKNLEELFEGVRLASRRTSKPLAVVRVGFKMGDTQKSQFMSLLGKGFLELGRITDEQITEFYKSINLLVISSSAEGFGLPLLEAMAHSTPVVSSDATSLKEVGGEAARFYVSGDASDLADAIVSVQSDGYDSELLKQGYMHANEFSWRSSLEKHYSLYDRIL